MLVYFPLMFGLALAAAWAARMPYAYAATQAFTAASNKCARGGGGRTSLHASRACVQSQRPPPRATPPLTHTHTHAPRARSFELAIAVAVGTFGLQSPEALAATVGPLIEVPVLLGLVHAALAAKRRWWDARDAALATAAAAAKGGRA